jgi:hypothetical protein
VDKANRAVHGIHDESRTAVSGVDSQANIFVVGNQCVRTRVHHPRGGLVPALGNHGHDITVNLLRKMGAARGHAQLGLQPAMVWSQPRYSLFALHPDVHCRLPQGESVAGKSDFREFPANDRGGRRTRIKPQTGGTQGRNRNE